MAQCHGPAWIAVESVYSMDGDSPDLTDLLAVVALAKTLPARLRRAGDPAADRSRGAQHACASR
jgi:hypothetical protein